MSDDRDIIWAAIGFGFGIWSFFLGFKRLRRKRLIENIPTSTVRGLAMGLVELYGKAESVNLLKSPLTHTECVLYRYLIEEYRRSGKSGHWVKIASGDSFYSPFWLNDETGRIMVFPQGAELILPVDYKYDTGLGGTLPENLIKFMKDNAIHYQGWLGTRKLRFQEWYICPQESVYVLGSAKKTEVPEQNYKDELMRRIEELKNSSEKMKEVDLNKDGEVSLEEWDLAVAKLQEEVLGQALENTQTDNPIDVIIGKADVEPMFMISDYSEKELLGRFTWQCFGGIFGGATLSLVLLAYLLWRLNLVRF